jgi:diguanylate cyclase (GGDEF)-like protein
MPEGFTEVAAVATDPAHSPRILIADDDPVSCYLLGRALSAQGYRVQCATDGPEALAAAQQPEAPRLLVLDWMMPGMSGPEVCAQLRQQKASDHYQYILLVSAKNQSNDVVAGLDAGADDYLTKPFHSSELLARLRVGSRMLRLQDELLAAQGQLRFQATHDSLTGIWNRGALMQLAQAETQRAQRASAPVGFLLIDLDHFKNVNDCLGHPTGDLVLQEVARRLSQAVRSYDIVGRYGGEEFSVVAAGLEEQQLYEYADRLRNFVAASPIDSPSGIVSVTLSIGVAMAVNPTGCDLDHMIRCADKALYEAKNKGRNRIALSFVLPVKEVA